MKSDGGTFELVDELILKCGHSNETATEQYASPCGVVIMLYKVVLTFESVR